MARALGGAAEGETHLLLDLIEVADVLGAKAVHLCLDRRRHRAQSLVAPALAPMQRFGEGDAAKSRLNLSRDLAPTQMQKKY